jgi:hypothetical protein
MVSLPGVASGSTFADLVVVNRGKTACTLPAQPKPVYLTADHKPLPIAFSSDPNLKTYDLAPGASAAMVIGYSSASEQPCHGKIAYVRITPPGDDLPFDGRMNCTYDSTHDGSWVAGAYAPPQ